MYRNIYSSNYKKGQALSLAKTMIKSRLNFILTPVQTPLVYMYKRNFNHNVR